MPEVNVSEGLATVPSAAMGLAEVVAWTRQQPFIDIMKTARELFGNSSSNWFAQDSADLEAGGYLDENGWPTEIPPGLESISTSLLFDLPEENVSMAGRYHLEYEGEGTIEIRAGVNLIDIVSDEDGKIVFDYTPGDGNLVFSIIETDPNGTGDYLRDMTLVKEEYLELHEAGAIFNPVWIDLIEDLGSVRFMDWMRTNGSTQSEWDDRPQVGDATYSTEGGVPLEIMVELANQIGSDPWFNIPFHATEEYIREFAAYVRDNLDPDLQARFEFSNEVWNFSFQQTHDADAAGRELWGTEFGNHPHTYYYGYKSAEVMDIIKDEFGAEADRVEGVLGVLTANPGRFENIMTGAERYASQAGANVDELFDEVAATWYFGGGFNRDGAYDQLKQWDAIGRDFMLDRAFEHMQNGGLLDVPYTTIAETTQEFAEWGQIAQQYGLDLTSYEGGTHLVGNHVNRRDDDFVDILTAINRDPRMLDLYNEIHSAWVDAGGGLFNAFQDVRRDADSGSWGHLTHLDDEDARWDAVMAINETPNENMPDRDVSDFDHGRTILGGNGSELLVGTLEEDFLIGAGGNDELHGGNKDDGLHGGDGNDHLYGGAGDDNVIGGAGNDWLDGGSGIDTVLGGAGNDTIVFDANDDFSNVDGGAGVDTLRVEGGPVPSINLRANGFERAESVTFDQGSEDWSERIDHYNADWVRTGYSETKDDGTSSRTDIDALGIYHWSEQTSRFDELNRIYEQTGILDDGQTWRTEWDVEDSETWSRQINYQDSSDSSHWSEQTLIYDQLGRLEAVSGEIDDGRTWQTVWDVDGTEAWSRQVSYQDASDGYHWSEQTLYYDDLNRLYEQTGTIDDGRTWQTVWDVDGTEFWSRQSDYQDADDAYHWSEQSLFYDGLGRLYLQTGTIDDGRTWQTDWDVNGTETWSRQINYQDQSDSYHWSEQTLFYDESNRLYEQTGTIDDGRTWRTEWDVDGTETWYRQASFNDEADAYYWTSQTQSFDDSNRLYLETGTFDDGRTWRTEWDLDNSESWAQQRVIYDTSDDFDWSEQVYEYDQDGNLTSHVIVDDAI